MGHHPREALPHHLQLVFLHPGIVRRGDIAPEDHLEAPLVGLPGGRAAAEARDRAADDDRILSHVLQDRLEGRVVECAVRGFPYDNLVLLGRQLGPYPALFVEFGEIDIEL